MRSPTESMDISCAVNSLACARGHLGYFKNENLKAAAKPIIEQLEKFQVDIEKLFQVEVAG
jgi:hypothetical protein